MGNDLNMTLVGLPLAISVFAVLLNSETPLLAFFTSVAAFAIAIAATAIVSILGSVEIFGSGVDMKDWSIKFVFVTSFLIAFYASNVLAGLELILSTPLGIGIIIFGALSTLFVMGIFGFAASGSGN